MGRTDDRSAPAMVTVLAPDGGLVGAREPRLPEADLRSMHRWMVLSRVFDDKMLLLQRQGRIGFYGEVRGEEAAVVGTGQALGPEDWVFPALRQGPILLMRGFLLARFVAANIGNVLDVAKGRQMPCHYSDRAHHHVSWSPCMATQLPHAAGAAYAAKIRKDKRVFVGYLGDGATSENDFHVALNFAGVHNTPNVFVCQNNQWAISVPLSKQTASASIAAKAVAYGIEGVRVDGNDVLAVYETMRRAVEKARAGGGPTLLEAVTFRMGSHSSSDDWTRYREQAVVDEWAKRDPIARFEAYLAHRGTLSAKEAKGVWSAVDAEIAAAITEAEKAPPPDPRTLFDDVYEAWTPQLRSQWAELQAELSEKD